jgi:hypothetical protein
MLAKGLGVLTQCNGSDTEDSFTNRNCLIIALDLGFPARFIWCVRKTSLSESPAWAGNAGFPDILYVNLAQKIRFLSQLKCNLSTACLNQTDSNTNEGLFILDENVTRTRNYSFASMPS